MNVRFYLSYDIKITLKSHFWHKKVIFLSLCTQHCYGRHNVSRTSVNHLWFIDFIAWRFSLPDAMSYDKLGYRICKVLISGFLSFIVLFTDDYNRQIWQWYNEI